MEVTTKSAQETKKLGQKIGSTLISESNLQDGGAIVLALYGELGSGKTTFVQGLAQFFGIPYRVLSPTYVISREYEIVSGNYQKLYHFDMYKTQESQTIINELNLLEIIESSHNVVVIEWPEVIEDYLPEQRIDVVFRTIGENKRKISTNDKYQITNYKQTSKSK